MQRDSEVGVSRVLQKGSWQERRLQQSDEKCRYSAKSHPCHLKCFWWTPQYECSRQLGRDNENTPNKRLWIQLLSWLFPYTELDTPIFQSLHFKWQSVDIEPWTLNLSSMWSHSLSRIAILSWVRIRHTSRVKPNWITRPLQLVLSKASLHSTLLRAYQFNSHGRFLPPSKIQN